MENLDKLAMIVRLETTQWRPRVSDAMLRRQLAEQNSGDLSSFGATKLLAQREEISQITKAVSDLMTYHYQHTAPWFDRGSRMLPCTLFLDYQTHMQYAILRIKDAVSDVSETLPEIKELAKQRLNGAFKDSDYPTPEDFRAAYTFRVAYRPLPKADDFRVELIGEAAADEIRAEIEAETKAQVRESVRDCYLRLYGAVEHMAEKLTAYDPTTKGTDRGTFRDSLVGNVRELVEILPHMAHAVGDAALDALCREAAALTAHTPETLRVDAPVRQTTAGAARAILAKMEGYCG